MSAEAPLLWVEALTAAGPRGLAGLTLSPAFVEVDLAVAPGEQVAICGATRADRTALLRGLALLERPASGRVRFEAAELTALPESKLRPLRRRFPYVAGDPATTLLARSTVAAALGEPLDIHRLGSSAERPARLAAALAALGLNAALLNRTIAALSAALRQRVAVARALILQPRLLLTDAVCDYLEPSAAEPLLACVAAACRAQGVAWLWTTADAGLARRFAERCLQLEGGRLSPA